MAEEKALTVFQQTRNELDGWAKEHITAVLPANVPWERFRSKALHALMVSPQVRGCDTKSIVLSIIKSATLGLEIGTQAHLVPFKTTCTFIPDYKGLIALMYRAGCLKVTARAVYEDDEFDYQYGTDEYIRHKPDMTAKREDADITHTYCIVTLPNGETIFRVVDRAEIMKTKARSAAGKSGPWVTDFEAMAIKTAVKRTAPFIQVDSAQLVDALDIDTKVSLAHETGNAGAIDAEYQDVDEYAGEIIDGTATPSKRETASIDMNSIKPGKPTEPKPAPAPSPERIGLEKDFIDAYKAKFGPKGVYTEFTSERLLKDMSDDEIRAFTSALQDDALDLK